jgi:hypothetical protein
LEPLEKRRKLPEVTSEALLIAHQIPSKFASHVAAF